MSRRASRILLVLAVAQTIAPSASGAPQTSAEDATQLATAIRQAALAVASPDATISLGPLNGAQYMQSCAGPLSVAISGTVPYEQAAAHCSNPAWTLYVTVTIAQSAKVVVAARPVTAGQSLGLADLTFAQEPVSLYAGRQVFHDTDQLIGASATMSLPTGTIVTSDNIAEPVVVKAGQTVSVSVISGGVNVSINAVADETGRIGDTILLTNPSSGRRFSALVTADGPVVQLQS
jgi:flagella basal body P-ring formation protein FlgA